MKTAGYNILKTVESENELLFLVNEYTLPFIVVYPGHERILKIFSSDREREENLIHSLTDKHTYSLT